MVAYHQIPQVEESKPEAKTSDVSELEMDVSLIDRRLLNLETDASLINQNLINVESDISDNENAIFGKHWQIFHDHFTFGENGKVIGWPS